MPDWTVQTPVSGLRSTTSASTAATSSGGGGVPYFIRASSPTNFGTPSWTTDYSGGTGTSRSGGTITLSIAGVWHVSFACTGSCNTTSGPAVGAVSYFLDEVNFGFALAAYSVNDSVSQFVGSGGIDIYNTSTFTVAFNSAGLYSAYDTDVISGEGGAHYMAAHWVGPN